MYLHLTGVIGVLDKKDFKYFGFLIVTLSSGVDYADISRLIGNFYHAQKHFYNIISIHLNLKKMLFLN